MKGYTREELYILLSAYADNECTENERMRAEELLRSDNSAKKEYELICRHKSILGQKKSLPPNEWFWQQLEPKLK